MEEKERFEYIHNDEIGDGLLDIKTNNEIYDIEQMSALLNQQDKEIIKLRGENQQLKEENGYIIFADGYDKDGNEIHKQEFVKYKDKFKELVEENKQLKQAQNQVAIDELEKFKNYIFTRIYLTANGDEEKINTYVDLKIKNLKGE